MSVPQKVVSDLQGIAPSQIIELFELQLKSALHGSNDVYRFHAGVNAKPAASAIVWNGATYSAYPVEAEGFEYNGEGQLPRPRLRVSNQLGLITAILLSVNANTPGNDLVGATVTRIRCLAKHLDATNFTGNVNPYGTPDPTAEFPREVYNISRKTIENRDVVEFELAAAFDLAGIRAPRRLCIANMCNWVYRSAECGYTGTAYFDDNDNPVTNAADDVCSKRLAGCEKRFASVLINGSVTTGSTTLSGVTTTQLASINVGDPVYGHGIPSGTTIASKGSSSVTMSQAANSSTTLTRTGTLSATGLAINVSSSANLRPGMAVSGTNVPANTTISSISGNTVNLSISFNPSIKGSLDTSVVTVSKGFNENYFETWIVNSPSGIAVGDYVGNAVGISDNSPQGTNVLTGTKIVSINGNELTLNFRSQFDDGAAFDGQFWQPATFSSATYTFTGSNTYTVRADGQLPFGSFPGVGGFYA